MGSKITNSVKKTFKKPARLLTKPVEVLVTEPIKEGIKVGSSIINSPSTKGAISSAQNLISSPEGGALLSAGLGIATGNPLMATSFLNRKNANPSTTSQTRTPQINVSTTPPINAVQPNNFMMPLLIGAGALTFILLRRK